AAVSLIEVEPIADEELVRNGKPGVADREIVDQTPVRPVEERADREVGRLAKRERAQVEVEREAGVDDVLDHEHVASGEMEVEVLDDPDARAAAERPAVAGEIEEVHRVRDLDRPREIRDEDEPALEHADEEEIASLVVLGDLAAKLPDSLRDLLAGQVDIADPRILGRSGT